MNKDYFDCAGDQSTFKRLKIARIPINKELGSRLLRESHWNVKFAKRKEKMVRSAECREGCGIEKRVEDDGSVVRLTNGSGKRVSCMAT